MRKAIFLGSILCVVSLGVASSCSLDPEESAVDDSIDELQSEVLAATDFDFTGAASRTRHSSFTTTTRMSRQNPTGSTRNNTYQVVAIGWRLSTDAVTVRRAASTFGGGVVTTTGLNTNAVQTVFTFDPRRLAVGTYYIYVSFTTRGEDKNTLIYKISITA